jgi:hypothetical protein
MKIKLGRGWLVAAAMMVVAAGVGGCGYHSGSPIAGTASTIHVEMFDNESFRRGLEAQLTEAVVNELVRRTPLRIVNLDQAETILTGKIVNVRERVVTADNEGHVFSKEVNIYVNFEWRNKRTGKVLARGVNLSQPQTLTTFTGVLTDTDTLGSAQGDLITNLATEIVDHMQGDW